MRKLIAVLILAATMAQAQTVWVAWDSPATNVDGSACTNLIAYRVYGGEESGNYITNWYLPITNDVTMMTPEYIPLYTAIAAVNENGTEGQLSEELYLPLGIPSVPSQYRRILFRFDSTNGVIVSVQ